MSCCPSTIVPFSGVAFTNIPYTPSMQQQYGAEPRVEVVYYDNTHNDFELVNGFSGVQIKFKDNLISIDHGGVESGLVKIS